MITTPTLHISNITGLNLDVFLALLEYDLIYKIVYPSQTTLARQVKCSRQKANEVIGFLKLNGCIIAKYRHRASCIYKISGYFYTKDVWHELVALFPHLRKYTAKVLLENKATQFLQKLTGSSKVTPLNTRDNFNTNNACAREEKLARIVDPTIQRIVPFKLTPSQLIKYAAFPIQCLQEGVDKLKPRKFIRDPFRWLFKVCLQWCTDNFVTPVWDHVGLLFASIMKKVTKTPRQQQKEKVEYKNKSVVNYAYKPKEPQKPKKEEVVRGPEYFRNEWLKIAINRSTAGLGNFNFYMKHKTPYDAYIIDCYPNDKELVEKVIAAIGNMSIKDEDARIRIARHLSNGDPLTEKQRDHLKSIPDSRYTADENSPQNRRSADECRQAGIDSDSSDGRSERFEQTGIFGPTWMGQP
jgi:hypothetical protein